MKPKKNYVPGVIDDCQTPGYAVEPLLPYINKFKIIWEPCFGEGYLANELEKHITVHKSRIEDGQDYFQYVLNDFYDAQITNPPYGLKFKWIEKAYKLNKPFALLLPVETIGAAKAQVLFKKYGIHVIYMSKRINFKMPKVGWKSSAQFPTAWFTWKFVDEEIGKYTMSFFDATNWNHKDYCAENYMN